MVADLDGEYLSGPNCLELARKMISTLFDFRKCADDSSLRVKDGGTMTVLCVGIFPRLENRVA